MATLNTVDITKFSDNFQRIKDFDKIVAEINKSPYLVDSINRFTGIIDVDRIGQATYFDPNKTRIMISSDSLEPAKFQNPAHLGRLVTVIAHEIGHAMEPGGFVPGKEVIKNSKTPSDYAAQYLRGEGVAVYAEYKVAHETGNEMWSDLGTYKLQGQLDKLLQDKYQGNIDDPKFREQAIVLGMNNYEYSHPSTAPHLIYREYYKLYGALNMSQHNYSPEQKIRIDWKNIRPGDFKIIEHPDGRSELTGSLPLKPPAAPTATQQGIPPKAAAQSVESAASAPAAALPNNAFGNSRMSGGLGQKQQVNEFPSFFTKMLDAYHAAQEANSPPTEKVEKPASPVREESDGPGF